MGCGNHLIPDVGSSSTHLSHKITRNTQFVPYLVPNVSSIEIPSYLFKRIDTLLLCDLNFSRVCTQWLSTTWLSSSHCWHPWVRMTTYQQVDRMLYDYVLHTKALKKNIEMSNCKTILFQYIHRWSHVSPSINYLSESIEIMTWMPPPTFTHEDEV